VSYPSQYRGHVTQPLAGESLLPVISQSGKQRERPLFWEHQGNCAVRWREWKLVREFGGDWELYDMQMDRTELRDLSDVNRSMALRLGQLYEQWADQCGVRDWAVLNQRFQNLYEGGALK
jgi:arylsulfatase